LLFGVLQWLMLWTYPLIGVLAVVVNLCAFGTLVALHGRNAGGQLLRWAVVNTACAAVLLQLFAPMAPQVLGYTVQWDPERGTDLAYLGQVGSYLYLGKPFFLSRRPEDPYPQLHDAVIGGVSPIHWAAIALALAAVALGVARLWRSGPAPRALALLLLLPGPLTWLTAYLGRVHLWDFYLIFMLPAWCTLLALGASWPLVAPQPLVRRAGLVLAIAGLLGFAAAGEPVRRYQRDHSVEPRRESVALTRPDPDPLSPVQADVLTASFFRPPDTYDPRVVHVRAPAELEALIERSDREGLPLFVNIGWLRQARRQRPELMALVEDRERFERVAELRGLTPRFSRRSAQPLALAACRPGRRPCRAVELRNEESPSTRGSSRSVRDSRVRARRRGSRCACSLSARASRPAFSPRWSAERFRLPSAPWRRSPEPWGCSSPGCSRRQAARRRR
jgi:hypothetical protein